MVLDLPELVFTGHEESQRKVVGSTQLVFRKEATICFLCSDAFFSFLLATIICCAVLLCKLTRNRLQA